MATRFRLLSGTQHSNDSAPRRSDSSGKYSTHASMRLRHGTVVPLLVDVQQLWKCGVFDRSQQLAT